MKIKITFESFSGLPEIIEFKDKEGKIQNLKLEEELEQIDDNIYSCEDAYFLGEDCDDYDNELDYMEEQLVFVAGDFENGIEYKAFEMQEDDIELAAEVVDDDSNEIYKKLNFVSARDKYTEINKQENTSETKEDIDESLKEDTKLQETEKLIDNVSQDNELQNDEDGYNPTFEESEKFGMSAEEWEYNEKLKIRERNKELAKEQHQEQSKEEIKEQTIEKTIVPQQSYDDELEL